MSEQNKAPVVEAEPYAYVYEYDSFFGVHQSLIPGVWNGLAPFRAIPVYLHPAESCSRCVELQAENKTLDAINAQLAQRVHELEVRYTERVKDIEYFERRLCEQTVKIAQQDEQLRDLNKQNYITNELYATGDENCPNQAKDRNGEVVLGVCKNCGRVEAELAEPCDKRLLIAQQAEEIALPKEHERQCVENIEQLRQYAERYRWLRNSSVGPSKIWELLSDDCQPPIMTLKCNEELDAAIDAAIKESKEAQS